IGDREDSRGRVKGNDKCRMTNDERNPNNQSPTGPLVLFSSFIIYYFFASHFFRNAVTFSGLCCLPSSSWSEFCVVTCFPSASTMTMKGKPSFSVPYFIIKSLLWPLLTSIRATTKWPLSSS